MSDPMDTPPVDFGSDRYDYVELIGAPEGVSPEGEPWFEQLVAEPCPDCRANVFIRWLADDSWQVTLAHDDGCPVLRRPSAGDEV